MKLRRLNWLSGRIAPKPQLPRPALIQDIARQTGYSYQQTYAVWQYFRHRADAYVSTFATLRLAKQQGVKPPAAEVSGLAELPVASNPSVHLELLQA